MRLSKHLPFLLFLFTGSIFSDDKLLSHTERDSIYFEKSIKQVANKLRFSTDNRHLRRNAKKLAEKISLFSNHFHNGYSRQHLRSDFRKIKKAYYQLMQIYRQTNGGRSNYSIKRNIRDMQTSYFKFEKTFSIYLEPRYANWPDQD